MYPLPHPPLSACTRVPAASPGRDGGGISPLLYFATASLVILRSVWETSANTPSCKRWEGVRAIRVFRSGSFPDVPSRPLGPGKSCQAAKKTGREQRLVLSSALAWIVLWPEGSLAELSVPSLSRSVCIPREDGGGRGQGREEKDPPPRGRLLKSVKAAVRCPARLRDGFCRRGKRGATSRAVPQPRHRACRQPAQGWVKRARVLQRIGPPVTSRRGGTLPRCNPYGAEVIGGGRGWRKGEPGPGEQCNGVIGTR